MRLYSLRPTRRSCMAKSVVLIRFSIVRLFFATYNRPIRPFYVDMLLTDVLTYREDESNRTDCHSCIRYSRVLDKVNDWAHILNKVISRCRKIIHFLCCQPCPTLVLFVEATLGIQSPAPVFLKVGLGICCSLETQCFLFFGGKPLRTLDLPMELALDAYKCLDFIT
jgi:hypothetical protein